MAANFQRLGDYDPAFTVDDSRQASPVRAAPAVGAGDKLGLQQQQQQQLSPQRTGYTGQASRPSNNPLANAVSSAGNQVRSALPASVLDQFDWMNDKRKVLLRAVLGEGLCTFLFMFIVCATHVNHVRSHSPDSLVLGAISTGFASIALIYSFADVSGAHFNPAVTFATVVTGKTSLAKGAMYVGIQLFASIIATAFVRGVYPKPVGEVDGPGAKTTLELLFVDIGATSDPGRAFVMEFILSFILVYVIFATAFDTVDTQNAIKVDTAAAIPQFDEDGQPIPTPAASRADVGRNLTIYTTSGTTKAGFAPLAIGMTLGFLCFIGGSVSGGAFNPARVFGPALVGGYWRNHWVYWFGDFMGAAAAGFTQSFFAHKPVQASAGGN